MPKTSERLSIDNECDVVSDQTSPPLRQRKTFRTISKEHVNQALTYYLRSLMMISKDEEVTNFNKAPDALDVKIEKSKS